MEQSQNETKNVDSVEYESPAIESIVTPDELEREVHYAGAISPAP